MLNRKQCISFVLVMVLLLTMCPMNLFAADSMSISSTASSQAAFDDFAAWIKTNGKPQSDGSYLYNYQTGDRSFDLSYGIYTSSETRGTISIACREKWRENYFLSTTVSLLGDYNYCTADAQVEYYTGDLTVIDSTTFSPAKLNYNSVLFVQKSTTESESFNTGFQNDARDQVIASVESLEGYLQKTGHTLSDFGFSAVNGKLVKDLGLAAFKKVRSYVDGQFTDVKRTDWYSTFVEWVYNYDLMSGTRSDFFNANGNVTIAETITMAAAMNSLYNTGAKSFVSTSPWYQTYVDYAINNGIITKNQFGNYNKAATRTEFVTILYASFPKTEYRAINNITEIPDVPKSMANADKIYTFYNAGIISGSDKYGTFHPTSNIKRSEVAVIIRNMIDASSRSNTKLEAKPVEVTGVTITGLNALSLYVGQGIQLTASVTPSNATNKTLTYTSSNTSVATVSSTGLVSVVGVGTATITIKANNGKYTTVSVTGVKLPSVRVYDITYNMNSADGVEPIISFANHSNKTIKYIYFTVTPYNAVGDVAGWMNRTTYELYVTGPLVPATYNNVLQHVRDGSPEYYFYYFDKDGTHSLLADNEGLYWNDYSKSVSEYKTRIPATGRINFTCTFYWDPIWYNNSIRKLVINKIVVEYMDGTKETIKNPTIIKK